MNGVRRTGAAIWDFVVGDDPITAAGVVLALGLTALVAAAGAAAWWVMPIAVVALLVRSLHSARPDRRRRAPRAGAPGPDVRGRR